MNLHAVVIFCVVVGQKDFSVAGAEGKIIIGFSCYALFRPRLIRLKQEWTAYPFSLLAGILGSAYNSNGPPIAIYGTLRRWAPDSFRANLQGFFFPSSVLIIAGHGLGGLWTPTVGWYFLLALPLLPSAIWIGNYLNRAIPPGRFDQYVHIILIFVGAILFIQTVTFRSSG